MKNNNIYHRRNYLYFSHKSIHTFYVHSKPDTPVVYPEVDDDRR